MISATTRLRDAPATATPWLPPEAPLQMPVQSLEAGTLAGGRLPSTPATIARRRALVFGGTAALALLATYQMWWLLRGNGLSVLEGVLLALFVPLFAWIALSFTSALAGFVQVLRRRPLRLGLQADGPLPELATRTALLVPVYNEDPRRTFAGIRAVLESVIATGQAAHFDCFILSDTRDAEIAAAEKILAPGESLPPDWPIAGTTGYDFANQVAGLMVDGDRVPALDVAWREFTGDTAPAFRPSLAGLTQHQHRRRQPERGRQQDRHPQVDARAQHHRPDEVDGVDRQRQSQVERARCDLLSPQEAGDRHEGPHRQRQQDR